MILDIYCYRGTESAKFFEKPQEGGLIWLDGTQGFKAGYFTDKETNERIQFILIPEPGHLPKNSDEFEKLPLIEAQVLEPGVDRAKVRILSVHPLGEWARRIHLTPKDILSKVPAEVRPTEEKCTEINDALRLKGHELWTSGEKSWDAKNKVSAIYFFKSEFDKRGLILTTNGAPSYLIVAGA